MLPFKYLSEKRPTHGAGHQSFCLSQNRALIRNSFWVGLFLFAPAAFAEVSVNVLSVPGIWLQAVLIGVVAIVVCSFRWWLGLPFMLLPIVIALSTLALGLDPDLAAAIRKEQGSAYFHNFYASALLATLLIVLGMWSGWRRSKAVADGEDIN